jgi:predicted small integral membrane protein
MFRLLKAALVLFVGLHALLYALQNIANLDAALAAISYVLSGADHTVYPDSMFFSITAPALHWAVLCVVIVGEGTIGFFGLKGAWDMFRARNDSAEAFHSAKKAGAWAAGLALLVWFGLFMTFGAAFFQMWQTAVGTGSMEGAFMYSMASVATVLFVYLTPDE